MKINANFSNYFPKNIENKVVKKVPEEKENKVSFKGIYIENTCKLGEHSDSGITPRFKKRDALLLNAIAQNYPNQDCFIRRGYNGYPALEYRERPIEIPVFTQDKTDDYTTSTDPDDEEYKTEPVLLYKDSPYTLYIGLPSSVSLNPTLPVTIQAGFELHKKMLEKKYQILDAVGRNDMADFGEEPIMKKAHRAIENVELAVTRYLMEAAYSNHVDPPPASQLYASNYIRMRSGLEDLRKLDLTTSYSKKQRIIHENHIKGNFPIQPDIVEIASKAYLNNAENQRRINEIMALMKNESLNKPKNGDDDE